MSLFFQTALMQMTLYPLHHTYNASVPCQCMHIAQILKVFSGFKVIQHHQLVVFHIHLL